jgi:hypothetical protein
LKFFRQNNYAEKAKILYFLNLVYFLSLVGLWQNHVLYWPLTGFMWRNRTPFGKKGSKHIWVSVLLLSIFFPWNFTHVSKNRMMIKVLFLKNNYIIDCLFANEFVHFCLSYRFLHSVSYIKTNCLCWNILVHDNKSVSHWIMFDYFFHVWKVNIFFFLIMFLVYSCSHV